MLRPSLLAVFASAIAAALPAHAVAREKPPARPPDARAADPDARAKGPAEKPAADAAPDPAGDATPPPAEPGEKRPKKPAGPDAGSPKTVLKTLAVAMQQGDSAGIRGVLYAGTPEEGEMVGAMAEMAAALAGLQREAVKAFGADGAKELTGGAAATPAQELDRIEAAKVRVEGDTATVRFAAEGAAGSGPAAEGEEGEPPVVLKRVEGAWRVPMSELSRGADAAALKQQLAALAAQTKLIREITSEIGQGKYKTAEKAVEAWRTQVYALTPKPPESKPEGPKPQGSKSGSPESGSPKGDGPAPKAEAAPDPEAPGETGGVPEGEGE